MAQEGKHLYEFGPFRLIPAESLLLRDGQPVPLPPKPFQVLQLLVENHGHLLDKDEMMKRLWPDSFVEEANLAKYVFTVREALGDDRNGSKYIQTLPKRGYRFIAPVRVIEANGRTMAAPETVPGVGAPLPARLEGRRLWPLLVGVALLVFGVTTLAWFRWGVRRAPSPQPTVTRLTAFRGEIGSPALSPDGNSIVFSWVGEKADKPELYLLRIGTTTPLRLTNSLEWEQWPAWSPDGNQIAFLRCATGACGIYVIPALGGAERKLIDLREDRYFWLAWSPDGKTIAFTERSSAAEPYALYLLSTETLEKRKLTSPPTGHLGELRFAFSADGKTLAVIRLSKGVEIHLVSTDSGKDVTLLEGQKEWFGSVAWGPDGKYLVLSADQRGIRRLWKLPIGGGALESLAFAGEDAFFPSASLDGRRLVYVHEFQDRDLWRITLEKGKVHSSGAFLSSTRLDLDPAFSPDGKRIAFVSERSGSREIWICDADGSNGRQLTSLGGPLMEKPSWSPDGRYVAFGRAEIRVAPVDGGPVRTLFKEGEFPSWSSDGRWVYFYRATAGMGRIWKVPAEGGAAVQVTQGEGLAAQEDPQGAYLYFSRINSPGIWRMRVAGGEETQILPGFQPALPGYWKVFPDGIYFVVGEAGPERIVVHHLRFLNLANRRVTEVATLSGALEIWMGGMGISPDRRIILYSQRTYQSSEIMLIENFP